jgi:hypothetical protein
VEKVPILSRWQILFFSPFLQKSRQKPSTFRIREGSKKSTRSAHARTAACPARTRTCQEKLSHCKSDSAATRVRTRAAVPASASAAAHPPPDTGLKRGHAAPRRAHACAGTGARGGGPDDVLWWQSDTSSGNSSASSTASPRCRSLPHCLLPVRRPTPRPRAASVRASMRSPSGARFSPAADAWSPAAPGGLAAC